MAFRLLYLIMVRLYKSVGPVASARMHSASLSPAGRRTLLQERRPRFRGDPTP
jgi:hypothetical protein